MLAAAFANRWRRPAKRLASRPETMPGGTRILIQTFIKSAPSDREFLLQTQTIRAIATRYDKTATNVLVAIHPSTAIIWLN